MNVAPGVPGIPARIATRAGLALLLGVVAAMAAPRDSALRRLDDARALTARATLVLDSLRGELARFETPPSASGWPVMSGEDSTIWREVLAEKRRRAELAAAFENRRASLGYTFNPNLVLGMNGTAWYGGWGAKVDGRVSLVTTRRALGANLSLLRAIHQFYLTGEEMYTRLYVFAGSGYYWERLRNDDGWYDRADQVIRSQLGAGTELGLKEMHGTRFVPEIGFQHSRFLTRYQSSGDYLGDSRPRSDYSLYPYYALHINFYFL